ncbi:CRISPR-associated protein, Csy4 family [Nitrosomonas cryotolerans]|uniref:CRISPR-associated endonuclease Csy4 n=1 Tax=Nitrosomonas cryotolerans ATCC 49181 TaxID=1131553 RepID=A0A1N6HFV0_9PROT|nr:type I-F CRISPR-associated endoribonuclease Cas6/Csy4 [Nitrosomonas cryotolerans]SFQ06447.1 CRISPR-associated protein, Csy4 family [Nitrosomonas cryotolerans]SIO18632.1 CRISPR-associated endonuclease Csy4 [Nitrosomonas cryotolerans ATCC 49181]
MKHYLEITLLPNPDINLLTLWSKVFQQIHLGLVELQDEQKRVPIGVSFPEYIIGEKYSVLGGKLRLFAQDESMLTRFDVAKWLTRLSDYVHCTSIRSVPYELKGYAIYQREQPKTNKERLARRYAIRHHIDYVTAIQRYSDMEYKLIPTPFIRLKSLSSDKTFCLWIKKKIAVESSNNTFSSYGLSAFATVPEF